MDSLEGSKIQDGYCVVRIEYCVSFSQYAIRNTLDEERWEI